MTITATVKVERFVFDKPSGTQLKVAPLPVGYQFTTEGHQFQWLLAPQGWVSAGAQKQYIDWHEVVVVPTPPPAKKVTNTITVYDDGSIDVTPAP